MNPSYSFDRAVDFYDATRAYPPDVTDKIAQSILDLTHATRATRIFELGIGTGRIAAPLIACGLQVVGLDLSREMMNRLRAKFDGGQVANLAQALLLVQGDASALPFPDATFDTALAVHVFHVIAPWRQATSELRRVLKPGGLVLHSTHTRDPHSANVILRDKWHRLVEARGEQWRRPGAQGREAIVAEFQSLGASLEEIPVVRQTDATTPQQEITGIAHRINSDTWAVSELVLQATVAELTDWARDHFGALDVSLPEENTFTWQVYRFDRAPLLPEPIRAALIQLIPILNATGAPWVLGGSCCLALHGVKVEPHDIDIVTSADGAYRIGDALRQAAEEKQAVQWSESERIRSHHGLYQMGDTQVDIIGAAELREGEGWSPTWRPAEWQTDSLAVPGAGVSVVTLTLEYELGAYRKLQREAKAQLIEQRLRNHSTVTNDWIV
jgi:ubiquinone/menaquinone biosynthesis C-methylase UbiE